MLRRQFDLFADVGRYPNKTATAVAKPHQEAAQLDDAALVAAIPWASRSDCRELTVEAGRRRLALAVPALEALCRRFAGFGRDRAIPEQTAAFEALAAIGGAAAAAAVARLLCDRVAERPGLAAGLAAAARLGVGLPAARIVTLLRDAAPEIRAGACGCARRSAEVVEVLVELLDDIDRRVANEAACALGRMECREARPALLRLLREAPSAAVIDALGAVADDEGLVLLGRLARTCPDLADAALAALDDSDVPRAAAIAAAARRMSAP
jgi:hypothetical protein